MAIQYRLAAAHSRRIRRVGGMTLSTTATATRPCLHLASLAILRAGFETTVVGKGVNVIAATRIIVRIRIVVHCTNAAVFCNSPLVGLVLVFFLLHFVARLDVVVRIALFSLDCAVNDIWKLGKYETEEVEEGQEEEEQTRRTRRTNMKNNKKKRE
jgi:hypothetical protein